jgi:hypothetical protein
LKAREKYCRGVGTALLHWRYRELHPESNQEDLFLMRQYFADILGTAVARNDSSLFREIAAILERLPQGDIKDDDLEVSAVVNDLNPVRFIIEARIKLEADMVLKRSPRRELTKREVKHFAKRLWAGERLVLQGAIKDPFSEISAEQEKLIQKEIKQLTDQDWTKLFKKAGCTDLKNAPAGRPSKKRGN